MRENHIRILCSVLKVDLVFEKQDGTRAAFFDNTARSPLMQSDYLRRTLRDGIEGQNTPFLLKGSYDCYYACLRAEGGLMYMGPMCHERLGPVKRRQMLRVHGIEANDPPAMPTFTLSEMRNMVLLVNSALENATLENEELLQLNRLINEADRNYQQEQAQFMMKEEAEDDSDAWRHSYEEEQLLLQAVREGRAEGAVRLAEGMDRDTGRLSSDNLGHWHNLAIVGITLCSRAAIVGGVSPRSAYRISGYYIQKCDTAQDAAHLLHYRNRAIEELAGRVDEKLHHSHTFNHVERCKNYIRNHCREKLSLDEVAAVVKLSPFYLSKLFKQETGMCFQDYVNQERVNRAADLLLFSDLSLPEIAHYVHFPNQSYFGKIFKKVKGISPGSYRDRYKNREV